MPLIKSPSQAAWLANFKAEKAAGKPQDQSLAIAFRVQRDARKRRADGGEVDDAAVRREDIPAPRPWYEQIEFKPQFEDRTPQDRPVQKGLADSMIAHAVDLAKTPGYTKQGKFERKPEVPGQWSDLDEAAQQIMLQNQADKGWEMGLNMVGLPGLTGGVPGVGSGVSRMGRYNPLTDADRMSIAAEEAVRKRGEGIPTGKSAEGWDFKRPDPTGFARDAAAARSGFRSDVGEAREGFSRETNPLMKADDWSEIDKPGFVLGSGSRDKRAGAAALANDARLAETDPAAYMRGERTSDELAAPREPTGGPAARESAPAASALPGDGAGGFGGGNRSVAEAQGAAERAAAGAKPLEGLPQKPLIVGDDHYIPGPIGHIRQTAEDYMKSTGRPYTPPDRYHPLDKEHSTSIAQAFEEMKHAPNDPAVKASYNALIDETLAQYRAMKDAGIKIEFIKPGQADPYAATPRLAARDVAENKHLWVFPTDSGFGTLNSVKDNPMLRPTDEVIGGHKLLANDVFRIVHDYFGHLKEGHGFRAAGEDNAWRAHSSMYSDMARPAMTTETRGQNSYVNYGPHGEKNRTANAADTTYADQKVGIMPEWTMRDRGSDAPIVAHHGTPHKFDKFSLSKVGTGEGDEVYGHGLYFAESPKVAKHYRDILTNTDHQPLLLNGKPVDQFWNDGIRERFGDEIKKLPRSQREDFVDMLSNLAQVHRMDQIQHVTKNFTPQQMKLFRDAIKPSLTKAPKTKGSLYEVALDVDPQQLLDWDKIFKEQTPKVRSALVDDLVKYQTERKAAMAKIIQRGPRTKSIISGRDFGPLARAREELQFNNAKENIRKSPEQLADEVPGAHVYRQFGLPAVDQKEAFGKASGALLQRGVPGLKYLDQSSRGLAPTSRAKRTSNYVMFDDRLVRILKRYGIALPGAGVAAEAAREPEARANGGAVSQALKLAQKINRKGGVHTGPILSSVAGRTDHHPMSVPQNSYVLPADHISSLGEGNTLAGLEVVNKMFNMGPYDTKPTKMRRRAAGGGVEKPVEIVAAGGETVIPPEKIIERFGDLDTGMAALDAWVIENRKHHIKTLSELPGPAQD